MLRDLRTLPHASTCDELVYIPARLT